MANYSNVADALDGVIKQVIKDTKQLEQTSFKSSVLIRPFNLDLEIDADGLQELSAKIEQAKDATLREAAIDLRGKLDASIVAFNLVKTGRLKNSLAININASTLEISYNVPYAALMQYGGYIIPYGNPDAEPVYISPRPWIDVVLATYDFASLFNKNLNELL